MKLFVVLSLLALVAAANSGKVACNYFYDDANGEYTCLAQIRTTQSDYTVDGVTGNHARGFNDYDVAVIAFVNNSMERMPRNLRIWFKHFYVVTFINDQVLPNFQPDDMNDFEYKERHGLEGFFARNLAKVTSIPKKTFYGFRLQHLSLDDMPNLMNFDEELLEWQTNLRSFSARGPNKIDRISADFFRVTFLLEKVDFSGTRLVRIDHFLFTKNVKKDLNFVNFENAGCLDKIYEGLTLSELPGDIKSKCQDITDIRSNNIIQQVTDSSSSESDQYD